MPLPQTAHEVDMMLQAFRAERDRVSAIMRETWFPAVFDLMRKRMFLQRPRTDDMMQMLADLDIEPPATFSGPSYDGLTFRLR